MKKRSLSGIFFRYKNPEIDQWENRTFEDLPVEEQRKILLERDKKWIESLALGLAERLRFVGDKFDITTEKDG